MIVFSKRDYLLVWKLVEYTLNQWTYLCKGVHCERCKQTVNAIQDRYRAEITYMLTSSRLFAIKDNTFDKSSFIRLFTNNCVTRTETLLVSFLMYVIFISPPDCCFRKSEFNNTFLCQNKGGIATGTSVTPPLPFVKTIKTLRSIRKFKHARHLY